MTRFKKQQLIHDKVVKASANTYKIHEGVLIYINPSEEKNFFILSNGEKFYPDVVITDEENRILTVEEIETDDSVNENEKSQWIKYASFGIKFRLVVPKSKLTEAKNLTLGINNIEIQGYYFDLNGKIYWTDEKGHPLILK